MARVSLSLVTFCEQSGPVFKIGQSHLHADRHVQCARAGGGDTRHPYCLHACTQGRHACMLVQQVVSASRGQDAQHSSQPSQSVHAHALHLPSSSLQVPCSLQPGRHGRLRTSGASPIRRAVASLAFAPLRCCSLAPSTRSCWCTAAAQSRKESSSCAGLARAPHLPLGAIHTSLQATV